jgi:hypothetical protein
VFQGLQAQRRELRDQMETLEERRGELAGQLHDPMVGGADRAGIEQRISAIDGRIAALDQQIAATDAEIARAAGVPGAVVEPRPGPPEPSFSRDDALGMGLGVSMLLLLPISIAYARRIWRRGAAAAAALPGDLYDRLTRIEQSVESVAIEVERIGEGQRFLTRTFAEQGGGRAIGAGAAQPIELKAHEATPQHRR